MDLGVYALVGGFLGSRVSMALNEFMLSLFSRFEEFSALAFWVARTLSLGLLLVAVGRFLSPKWEHFRAWKVWPPLLLSIPLGFWVFTLFAAWPATVGSLDGMVSLCAWLNIAFSTTGFAAFAIIKSHQPRTDADSVAAKDVPNLAAGRLTEISIEDLRLWVREEAPIVAGNKDLFCQEPRAKRLSKLLLKPRQDGKSNLLQTTVIQGPFGSGKTSLIRLIKNEVRRKHANVIFVDIDCWGFSTLGAQEHVLEKIVASIANHFDVFGMQQLPAAYSNALQESSGWIHGVLQMLDHRSSDPVEVLKRITPVLEATQTFLVVVIEESDRNDHEFEPKKIEALLHRLRQVERVSFILAAAQSSQIDFAKVAENVEPIPSLNPVVAATLLARMINEWGDPQKSGIRVPFCESEGKNAWSEDVKNPRGGVRVLAAMIRTPRTLKHVLREVGDAWDTLRGEVDLYDLLCVSVLRHCMSPIFDWAVLYHRDFPSLSRGQPKRNAERIMFIKSELAKAIGHCEIDPGHAQLILERLFPRAITPDIKHEDPRMSLEVHMLGVAAWPLYKYQSVKSSGAKMYWQRLISKDVDESWPRDQDVLRGLAGLQVAETLDQVASSCVDSLSYRLSVGRFLQLINYDDHELLRAFAGAVWEKAKPFRSSDKASWNGAFMWVQDWLPNDANGSNAGRELFWYVQLLQKFLKIDLDDALSIYQCARDRMAGRNTGRELKSYMLNMLHAAWSPEGSYLCKLCRDGFNNVLLDILYEVVSDGKPDAGLQNAPEWMVDLILRDLREDANRAAPFLYRVIAKDSSGLWRIDLGKTQRLFQSRSDEALQVMATHIDPEISVDTVKSRKLASMRDAAHEALASEKVARLAESQAQESLGPPQLSVE